MLTLFHRDLGPLNYYLGLLGSERISWLNSSAYSPTAILIADVWKNVGFYVLVFLGGMQAISREFYEAAEVDGATPWNQFWYITLPLLSPTILFLSIISVIGALQIFEQPQILTNGGPGDATRTIVLYIYEHGFRFFDMGYAQIMQNTRGDVAAAQTALWGNCLNKLIIAPGKIAIYGVADIGHYLELVKRLQTAYPQYEFVGEMGSTIFEKAYITKDPHEVARIRSVAERASAVVRAT